MKLLLDAVQAALDVLRDATDGRVATGLPPGELIAVNAAAGVLRRAADAAIVPIAAEIARQSRRELGRGSLAKQQGFSSVSRMVAATMGTGVGEANRMLMVGEAIAPRVSDGETLPARHPHVAKAIMEGTIGTMAASAIITMLDGVASRAREGAIDAMEAHLVDSAPGLSQERLQALVARGAAALDPDGLQPKEEELRARRGLTIRQDASGAIAISGRFAPFEGAQVMVALEGMVTGMLRRNENGTSVAVTDERTVSQMRADALTEICRHGISCQQVPTAPSTTVVVRLDLSDLEQGTGIGTIDGVGQPVPIATVRQMAAEARIIPCVLGSDSEVLDWGRAKRSFTPSQKLALAERDGGCASCGLPAGFTAVHHIRWWSRDAGPTDLANGILLCTNCHHRIHDDGWEMRIERPMIAPAGDRRPRARNGPGLYAQSRVWFIPPRSVDPVQAPRLGGRARFDLTA